MRSAAAAASAARALAVLPLAPPCLGPFFPAPAVASASAPCSTCGAGGRRAHSAQRDRVGPLQPQWRRRAHGAPRLTRKTARHPRLDEPRALPRRQRAAREAPARLAQRGQQQHRLARVHRRQEPRDGGRVHGRQQRRLVLRRRKFRKG